MQVSVVCRLNQARSPFGQAVLETFFPDICVKSFGAEVKRSSPVNGDVCRIAKEWKISHVKEFSEQLASQKEFLINSDLVILTEDRFENTILDLGYKGKIISFDRFIRDNSFIPIDPVGLSRDKLEQELAKTTYCCVQALRSYFKDENCFPITAVIPATEGDTALAYSYVQVENTIHCGIIIDCDFRAPSGRHHFENSEVFEFDLDSFETNPNLLTKVKILSPAKEHMVPQAKLLSKQWREILFLASAKCPIYIVTAPRYTERSRLPDSYLSAIWADKIVVIGS